MRCAALDPHRSSIRTCRRRLSCWQDAPVGRGVVEERQPARAQLDGVERAAGAPDPHAHVLLQPCQAGAADPLFVADVGGNERLPAYRRVGHRADVAELLDHGSAVGFRAPQADLQDAAGGLAARDLGDDAVSHAQSSYRSSVSACAASRARRIRPATTSMVDVSRVLVIHSRTRRS